MKIPLFPAIRLLCVAAVAAPSVPLLAQQASPTSQLDPIDITGQGDSYGQRSASTGTKTSAPVLETPLTEEVITQQLIKDRAMQAPNDYADVVAGVQPLVGYGNSPSQWFLIRGFDNQSINYRDGFRVSEPFTSSPRDLANVESVEFVKGPGSVLYGASQPGGSVNTITKAPLDHDAGYAAIAGGSYQFLRETVDVNRSFGDIAARIVLAHDAGNSYVDLQSEKNFLLAPSVRFRFAPGTELVYKGEYQHTAFNGFGNGLPNLPFVVNLPAGYTYAEPWTYLNNINQSHLLDLHVTLADGWVLRQGLYYGATHRNYNFVNPAFATDPANPNIGYGAALDGSNVQRYSYAGPKDNPRNTSSQTEITGHFHEGGVTQTVLGGLEIAKTVFDFMAAGNTLDTVKSATFVPGGIPPLPIFNPYNYPGGFFGSRSQSSTTALYAQDQLAFGRWRVLAGLRTERVHTGSDSYADATGAVSLSQSQSDSDTTGRVGLLYLITPATSAYYSFGQSFVPNLGTDAALKQFNPERAAQNEIGFKTDISPQLEATVSAFDIVKRNILTADPNNPRYSAAIGEAQSRGFEASLAGNVTPGLRLTANAAQLDAKVTQDAGNPANVGSTLVGVPRFSTNLWAVQDLTLGVPGRLSVGAGVVHQGSRAAAVPNLSYFSLPAYDSVDLGVFYKINSVDIAFNVKNVGNAVILTSQEGDNVLREANRNYLLTVGVKF